MKNLSLLFLLPAFIFFSCSKDDDTPAAPTACFTVDATETIDSTHLFLFDQCQPYHDLCYWDFGDGGYSSNPNPGHQFNHIGTFNVKLTVSNTTGQSSEVTHTITIGHYSLDKIVYTQPTSAIAYPKWLIFSPFSLYDSLNNITQLPVTRQLADNSTYDLIDSVNYFYAEQNVSPVTQGFWVYPSSIGTSKTYDAALLLLGDTAKFTLHYKIVPR